MPGAPAAKELRSGSTQENRSLSKGKGDCCKMNKQKLIRSGAAILIILMILLQTAFRRTAYADEGANGQEIETDAPRDQGEDSAGTSNEELFGVKKYLKEAVNPAYSSVDQFVVKDVLDYRTTFIDESVWSDTDGNGITDLRDVYSREDYEKYNMTVMGAVPFYNLSEESAYFIAYLPTDHDVSLRKVSFDLTVNDNRGQVLPDAAYIYDADNALLYVQKTWFSQTLPLSAYMTLRSQTVFLYPAGTEALGLTRLLPVSTEVIGENAAENSITADLANGKTAVPLISSADLLSYRLFEGDHFSEVSASMMTVYINGEETKHWGYDAGTGMLSISYPVNSVSDVHVVLSGLINRGDGTDEGMRLRSIPPTEAESRQIDAICAGVVRDLIDTPIVIKDAPNVGDNVTFGDGSFVVGSNLPGQQYPLNTLPILLDYWSGMFGVNTELAQVLASLGTDAGAAAVIEWLSTRNAADISEEMAPYTYNASGGFYVNGVKYAELPPGTKAGLYCTHITMAEAYAAGLVNTVYSTVRGNVIKVTAPASGGIGYIYLALGSNGDTGDFGNGLTQAQFGIARIPYRFSTGVLSVRKLSSDPTVTDGNGAYSFSGIRFKVYTDEACTAPASGADGQQITLIADGSGVTQSVQVRTGTYYVREEEGSLSGKPFAYNGTPVRVDVTENHTAASPAAVTIVNRPNTDPIGILLKKADETLGTEAEDAAL